MDILTGLILDYVIDKGLVMLTMIDESRMSEPNYRKTQTFRRGKYSRKDFAAYNLPSRQIVTITSAKR